MKKILALAIISILLLSTFSIRAPQVNAGDSSDGFSDDFSTDTGMWEYLGFAWPGWWGEGKEYTAYRDATQGYVVLTPDDFQLAGVLWLKSTISPPFTVNFRYLAGGGYGGADGLVMMFCHEKPPYLWSGGSLSFLGSGYGIEFDNYPNYMEDAYGGPPITDPVGGPHIAIMKDNPSNHLAYVSDPRTGDNIWHNVRVVVDDSSITVYVDSDQVIHWQGTIDGTYSGLGFAGTTGGYTNWHLIDDFSIETEIIPIIPATIDFDPDTLNLRSKGQWVTVYIELPMGHGYDVAHIDRGSVILNSQVQAEAKPTEIGDYDKDGIRDLMVKFNRSAVQAILKVGEKVKITICGKLINGRLFEGSDTIRVISQGK